MDAGLDGAAPDAPMVSPELTAVWPPLAPAGSMVTLEGTFADQGIIHLPGGSTAEIQPLGPHRATMVVPSGATLGELSLTTANTTTGRVGFHAVTYQLGLQLFEDYEQTGTGREAGFLPDHLVGQGSIVLGGSVYAFGGRGSGGFTTAVEQAPVNADGSLGAFAVRPDLSLVAARAEFATVVIDNYVYVIGGLGSVDSTSSSVERAPIQPDGTLGTFAAVPGATLTQPRNEPMAAVIGDYLYVLGGDGSTTLDSVERAPIAPDGTVGAFELLPDVKLATPRSGGASVVIGDSLYVFGGANNPSLLESVEVAPIHPDGTLGEFATSVDVTFAAGRIGFTAAILGDGLYTIGGDGLGFSDGAELERAPIQPDGTLGTFVNTGEFLRQTSIDGCVAVAGNYLYVLGGETTAGGGGVQTIQRLSLDKSSGLASSTIVAGTTLATATFDHGLVASGNNVYVLGGATSPGNYTSAVQQASVSAGLLGSFATATSSTLSTARGGFATVVAGSYVYVIGGNTASGVVGTLERATIAPDGSIGPFSAYTDASLVTPRADATAVVVSGYNTIRYLIIIGGIGADGTILGTVEYAPVQADGSLGAFAVDSDAVLKTPRYAAAVVVHGANVEVIGGIGSTGYLGDVEQGHVDLGGGPPIAGDFEGLSPLAGIALATPRAGACASVIGNQLYLLGGVGASGPLADVETTSLITDVNGNETLTAFASASGTTLSTARGFGSCVAIANQLYTIGGQASSSALGSIEATTLQ